MRGLLASILWLSSYHMRGTRGWPSNWVSAVLPTLLQTCVRQLGAHSHCAAHLHRTEPGWGQSNWAGCPVFVVHCSCQHCGRPVPCRQACLPTAPSESQDQHVICVQCCCPTLPESWSITEGAHGNDNGVTCSSESSTVTFAARPTTISYRMCLVYVRCCMSLLHLQPHCYTRGRSDSLQYHTCRPCAVWIYAPPTT